MKCLAREYDKEIIPAMMTIGTTELEMQSVNWCRQYLNVMTMSDILHSDGKTIHEDIKNHKRRNKDINNRYKWPKTKQPSKRHWEIWDKRLRDLLSVSTPLGYWQKGSILPKMFMGDDRTTIWNDHETLQIISTESPYYRIVPRCQPNTARYVITGTWVSTMRFKLHSKKLINQEPSVEREAQTHQEVWICSDGGWEYPIATSGTIIYFPETKKTVALAHQIPPGTDGGNAYRSELGGILSGIQWTTGKTIHSIRIICDNQQALWKCTQKP